MGREVKMFARRFRPGGGGKDESATDSPRKAVPTQSDSHPHTVDTRQVPTTITALLA